MRPSAHAATAISSSHGHHIASSITDPSYAFSSSSPSPSLDQSCVDNPGDDPSLPCRDSGHHHHQVPASTDSTRVKLLCSYGGRIISRPHNNQLGYTGGESRIIVVPRFISFSDFVSKLSRIAFKDDHFHISVKYQLPSEDLDALISITCDEDLENMMDEFDKMQLNNQINRPSSAGMNRSSLSANSLPSVSSSSNSSSSVSPSRIRLFLFPAKNTGRSQSDSIPDAKFGRNHQQPRDALNQGPSPSAAEIAPAIPAKQSHFAIPDYGNADKEDGNLHLLRETSANSFEVWASARSYGNATKDDGKSFRYGLQGEKMNGTKVFPAQENVINQVAGIRLGSHGGVNIEVESDIQDLNEGNKGMSDFEKKKSHLQKISRDSHGRNVNKLVEFDHKTMNDPEMEGPGFTGDPIFDEDIPSLRNDLGILDHLERSKLTLEKSTAISSRQFQASPAMTISDQSHHVQAVQPKDRSNSTYSTSKIRISAENDAIPSRAVQDAATKPWPQVPDPSQSRGKGLASAGSGKLPANTAPTVYSLNPGFSTISSTYSAVMDPLPAQKVASEGVNSLQVQPLQDAEKKKKQQLPVISHVLQKDVATPPWNTGRKLPSTTVPLTHETCFVGLDTMSRSTAMDHQYIPVQNNASAEGAILDLHPQDLQYEPSLRDAPAKMMMMKKKSNTTPGPVYNMPVQGSITDQDERPPFTLFSNLYPNMVDHPGNVVESPYPNASNVGPHTHEDVTVPQHSVKINPFMDDFHPYKLDEHNHNNIAVELASAMLPSTASSSQRSRPYIL